MRIINLLSANYLKRESGFFSLLAVFMALAIISFLAYIILNNYFPQAALFSGRPDSVSGLGSGSIGNSISGSRALLLDKARQALDSAGKEQEKRTNY